MRNLLMFALVATFAFGATALVATDADARAKAAGIVGSAHDFTDNLVGSGPGVAGTAFQEIRVGDTGFNFRGEICRVCHVPHDHGRENFLGFDGDGLLWNHVVSSETYAMYTSETLAGTPSAQPVGKSKLCLGCHDGTVALNAFDRNNNPLEPRTDAGNNALFIQGVDDGFQIGTAVADGLMGTHPISIQYVGNTKIGAAGGLINPATAVFPDSGMSVAAVLEGGMVQCHSCHDVHDSVGINATGTRLNRASQNASHNGGAGIPSGLCLSCHNK